MSEFHFLLPPNSQINNHWQPLLSELIQAAIDYFGEQLLAVYLLGSIGRGQEQIGSSDLDLEWVLDHKATESEQLWAKELSEQVLSNWPDLLKIDLDLLALETLQAPESKRLRFIFASDGIQLWGQKILSESETWQAGPELAWLLNSHFRWARSTVLESLHNPTLEEQKNPRHVAECQHWISKQALRLGLGLAMCKHPVYTRTVAEMPSLIGSILPELSDLMQSVYASYQSPTNDLESALSFMESLAPLYQRAEAQWPKPSE